MKNLQRLVNTVYLCITKQNVHDRKTLQEFLQKKHFELTIPGKDNKSLRIIHDKEIDAVWFRNGVSGIFTVGEIEINNNLSNTIEEVVVANNGMPLSYQFLEDGRMHHFPVTTIQHNTIHTDLTIVDQVIEDGTQFALYIEKTYSNQKRDITTYPTKILRRNT